MRVISVVEDFVVNFKQGHNFPENSDSLHTLVKILDLIGSLLYPGFKYVKEQEMLSFEQVERIAK